MALTKASEILKNAGIAEWRREANSLLELALKVDKVFLIANPDHEISPTDRDIFNEYVKRRSNREPFQHIAGKQEFWGLDFIVTPDVMIPRPETEMIVEEASNLFRDRKNVRFCEIGIGSGCISVSILHELKTAEALAVDISESALLVARENAERNSVSERLELGVSNVFNDFGDQKFDFIVSNPPYVPVADISTLQPEVKAFDPKVALTDGGDGLSIIRRIIEDAPKFLLSEGYLLMEIGFNQSEKVRQLFDMHCWSELEFLPDLQGIPRLIKARI